MDDKLFDTEDKKAAGILQFQALEANQGWQLLVRIVSANIKVLEDRLKNGEPNQTIEDVNRLRDKIKDHENFINTPAKMIKMLQTPEGKEPEDDPFE